MTDKTKTPRELALEALKKPPSQADDAIIPRGYSSRHTWNAAIDACIEALSQEQPEPIEGLEESISFVEQWNDRRKRFAVCAVPSAKEINDLAQAARQFHNLTKKDK